MHRNTGCLAAITLTMAGCEPERIAPPDVSAGAYRTEQEAEDAAYAADIAFFQARRDAYERRGTIPTVPPSLSSDPYDPEYKFVGYMDVLERPEEDEDVYESTAEPGAEEEDANARPLGEDDEVARVVNDVGETWSWHPEGLEDRLAARRRARGQLDERDVPATGRDPGEVEREVHRNVLGTDNRNMRSAFSGHDMTEWPWRSIGSLETNGRDPTSAPEGRCTATKVGERHLLTAAHCVFDEGGGEESLDERDWWPGADGIDDEVSGGDPTPNGYKHVLWYVYNTGYTDWGWDTRDYAVLVLYDNESSCGIEMFGYRVDNSLANYDFWNFGYPANSKECPDSSPAANDDCAGSQWGMEAEIDSTSASYVYHDHDMQEGQSGSPIYDYNGGNRQIVAHWKGAWTATGNRGIKMRGRVFDFIEAARDEYDSSICSW
jgi:hypothetical protein